MLSRIWLVLGYAFAFGSSLVIVFKVMKLDYNIVTAPNVILAPIIIFDFIFQLAYMYSARRNRGSVNNIVIATYIPSILASCLGMAAAMIMFTMCKSPINTTFFYIFELTLLSVLAMAAIVAFPWASFYQALALNSEVRLYSARPADESRA